MERDWSDFKRALFWFVENRAELVEGWEPKERVQKASGGSRDRPSILRDHRDKEWFLS